MFYKSLTTIVLLIILATLLIIVGILNYLSIINFSSNYITAIATVILAVITTWYVILTHKMLEETKKADGAKIYLDLEIYQNTYKASVRVALEVLPNLPAREKFDLTDQLSRSSKAAPRLIAEGYGKKHQKHGFQKYLDDAMTECNETIVSLEHCKDIYRIDKELCDDLIAVYDKSARQIFRLAEAWDNFTRRTKSDNQSQTSGPNHN